MGWARNMQAFSMKLRSMEKFPKACKSAWSLRTCYCPICQGAKPPETVRAWLWFWGPQSRPIAKNLLKASQYLSLIHKLKGTFIPYVSHLNFSKTRETNPCEYLVWSFFIQASFVLERPCPIYECEGVLEVGPAINDSFPQSSKVALTHW